MSEGKPSAGAAQADPEGEDEDAFGSSPETLKERGDVDGLLTLAKAFRAGTAPGGRDLRRCLEAYRAAAEIGSADGEYAVALFFMSGGVVGQDLKEGASRLRAAAEKGSVPAKVYLGNLYELGIHYKADAEKADVWYRNAARGARVTDEPGTEAYARELAELGCARHVLALVAGGTLDAADAARLLQRARAHGYALRMRDDVAARTAGDARPAERLTFLDALESADAPAASPVSPSMKDVQLAPVEPGTGPTAPPARAPIVAKEVAPVVAKEKPTKRKPARPSRAALGLAAFGYALLFAVAGIGAGYAATLGGQELVAHGQALPWLGARTHLVFPIVFAVVGVLPAALVYRLGTVLRASVLASVAAGIGWMAWGTGQGLMHPQRLVQALAFGIAGFLAALLVLGLLGGTKKQSRL